MKILRGSALFVLVVVVATGALTGAGIAVKRLTTPVEQLTATVHAPATVILAAPQPPPVALPATGSLALAQFGGALLAERDATQVRPTGSVAKTMTALVTLHSHPLAPGAPGPVLTMTEGDVELYRQAVAEQGSAVAVEAGERLTERQLLLALLLPSANNIAETLARWVAGNDGMFDDMLNSTARSLGMTATHFADRQLRTKLADRPIERGFALHVSIAAPKRTNVQRQPLNRSERHGRALRGDHLDDLADELHVVIGFQACDNGCPRAG